MLFEFLFKKKRGKYIKSFAKVGIFAEKNEKSLQKQAFFHFMQRLQFVFSPQR